MLLIDPKLTELRRGPANLPDRTSYDDAVHQAFAHPELSIGGWEPAQHAQQRVVASINQIAAQASGPVALVSHGLILSLLVAHLRRQPQVDIAEWRSIPLPALAVVDLSTWQVLLPFRSIETWENQPYFNRQGT